MSNKRNSDSGGLGCAFGLLMAVFAMPIVGVYLIASGKEEGQKTLGVALLIVEIIVWIKLGIR